MPGLLTYVGAGLLEGVGKGLVEQGRAKRAGALARLKHTRSLELKKSPGYADTLEGRTSRLADAKGLKVAPGPASAPPTGFRKNDLDLAFIPGGPADPKYLREKTDATKRPKELGPGLRSTKAEILNARKTLADLRRSLGPGAKLTDELTRRSQRQGPTGRPETDYSAHWQRLAWLAQQVVPGGGNLDQTEARVWQKRLFGLSMPKSTVTEAPDPASPAAAPPQPTDDIAFEPPPPTSAERARATLDRIGPRPADAQTAPPADRGSGTREDPFRVTTEEEFDVIESGEFYINPRDGRLYRKR